MTARYPVVLGIDPSSGVTGLARLDTLTMTMSLAAVTPLPDFERTWLERLAPELELMSPGVDLVALERPALVAKEDTGLQLRQGEIGFAIGRTIGNIECWSRMMFGSGAVRLLAIRDWRVTRDAELARCRVKVPDLPPDPVPPSCACRRVPIGKNLWMSTWACGHTARTSKPLTSTACPRCTKGFKPVDPAARRRELHKLRSYALARHYWPAEVERIEAAARGRARSKKGEPGHRLVGVSDACEAAVIALHEAIKARGTP